MKRPLYLALTSSLLACSAEPVVLDETSGRVQLCAFGGPETETAYPLGPSGPQSFAAGTPLVLRVAGASCVSSSCTTDVVASCRATLEGQTVRVEADFSWTETTGACTDDCRSIMATCTTPALSAGLYTIVLGTRSATVTVGAPGPQTACIAPTS
jgi:hypothetical protein